MAHRDVPGTVERLRADPDLIQDVLASIVLELRPAAEPDRLLALALLEPALERPPGDLPGAVAQRLFEATLRSEDSALVARFETWARDAPADLALIACHQARALADEPTLAARAMELALRAHPSQQVCLGALELLERSAGRLEPACPERWLRQIVDAGSWTEVAGPLAAALASHGLVDLAVAQIEAGLVLGVSLDDLLRGAPLSLATDPRMTALGAEAWSRAIAHQRRRRGLSAAAFAPMLSDDPQPFLELKLPGKAASGLVLWIVFEEVLDEARRGVVKEAFDQLMRGSVDIDLSVTWDPRVARTRIDARARDRRRLLAAVDRVTAQLHARADLRVAFTMRVGWDSARGDATRRRTLESPGRAFSRLAEVFSATSPPICFDAYLRDPIPPASECLVELPRP